AAYRARAAPALPAVGTTRFEPPRAQAIGTATAIPRALNVPVGFRPSSFTYRAATLTRATRPPDPRCSSLCSGVPPSPRERISDSSRGRRGAYRQRSFLGRSRSTPRSVHSYRANSGPPQSQTLINRTSQCFEHAVHSRKAGRTTRSCRAGPYHLSRDAFISVLAFDPDYGRRPADGECSRGVRPHGGGHAGAGARARRLLRGNRQRAGRADRT